MICTYSMGPNFLKTLSNIVDFVLKNSGIGALGDDMASFRCIFNWATYRAGKETRIHFIR